MTLLTLRSTVLATTLALAVAQDPAPAPAPAPSPANPPDATLVSLQGLLTEGVYLLDPLQAEAAVPDAVGTYAMRPFAAIHDARFADEGRLLAFVVRLPGADPGGDLRQLPADEIVWHEPTRRWIVRNNLQFGELEVVAPAVPSATTPVATPPTAEVGASPSWTARELLQAVPEAVVPLPAPKPAEGEADAGRKPAGDDHASADRATIWFAPKAARLAFASFPVGRDIVPVPWSALALRQQGSELRLRTTAGADRFATAPRCASLTERPTATLRRLAYAQFGIAVPPWDRLGSSAPLSPPSGAR